MLPTLPADGSILVVSALAYWRPKWMGGNRRPERGDLVTFPSPSNPEYAVCKRVVGLPGDIVEVEPRRSDDDPGWLAGHVVERRGQGVFIKVSIHTPATSFLQASRAIGSLAASQMR